MEREGRTARLTAGRNGVDGSSESAVHAEGGRWIPGDLRLGCCGFLVHGRAQKWNWESIKGSDGGSAPICRGRGARGGALPRRRDVGADGCGLWLDWRGRAGGRGTGKRGQPVSGSEGREARRRRFRPSWAERGARLGWRAGAEAKASRPKELGRRVRKGGEGSWASGKKRPAGRNRGRKKKKMKKPLFFRIFQKYFQMDFEFI